jgi:MFS family permease
MTPERRRQLVRAVLASTVGTSIEWYDFFLYNTAIALVLAKQFFPSTNPATSLLVGFATQFVGFVARPIGAFIFGHFGDRIGRKATLIATLLTMGLASAAIGLVPGYAVIGIWGGIILTILRILQGIGVGGEWGGSVLVSMEWGTSQRRGFNASWPQVGVPVGLILGNAVLLLFSAVSGSAFGIWGWRVPFLLSLVLVGIGLYIRLGILETPTFTRLLEQRRIERQPLWEAMRRYPGEIVASAFVRMSEQAPFYLYTSFVIAFGVDHLHFNKNFMLLSVIVAAIVSLITLPVAGYLSDRFGRKLIYGVGAVASIVYAFPYFLLLGSGVAALAMLAVVLSLITHDFQYGPQAALIAESFTGRVRYSGSSLGYQFASIIAGGPSPLIATALLAKFGATGPISGYIIFCAVLTLIALALIPNRQALDHAVEYDEAEPAAGVAQQPAT